MVNKTCSHDGAVKEILKADVIDVQCRDCKEVFYQRTRVNSSNIFSIGTVDGALIVEFMSGYPNNIKTSLYRYPSQGHQLAEMLKAALSGESVGEYFTDEIKAEVGDDYEQIR